MNEDGQIRDLNCARAVGYVHQRLDGDELDPDRAQWLSRHLDQCADCRQAEEELRQIQQALRGLSVDPFPQDALDEVWDRTTRTAGRRGSRPVRPAPGSRDTNWRSSGCGRSATGP